MKNTIFISLNLSSKLSAILKGIAVIAVLALSTFFSGCTEKKVEAIQYGQDYCHYCKMQITDKRYGGAILTKGGITNKYDSLECLAAGAKKMTEDIKEIYFVSFENSELIEKSHAHIHRNDKMHGPMGTDLQVYKTEQSLPAVKYEDIGKE